MIVIISSWKCRSHPRKIVSKKREGESGPSERGGLLLVFGCVPGRPESWQVGREREKKNPASAD